MRPGGVCQRCFGREKLPRYVWLRRGRSRFTLFLRTGIHNNLSLPGMDPGGKGPDGIKYQIRLWSVDVFDPELKVVLDAWRS
jgi:hypothetical protein